jgi:hypothetical protein
MLKRHWVYNSKGHFAFVGYISESDIRMGSEILFEAKLGTRKELMQGLKKAGWKKKKAITIEILPF